MSRVIMEYMIVLAEDEDARARHKDDPEAAMLEFGLSEEEREIVASNDHERIRKEVAKHDPKVARTLAIVTG
jgi:hypothetical protein